MNNIPSIFEIPGEVRAALPDNVKNWLATIESRIDGLTLKRIQKEASKLAGPTEDPKKLYRLGRRLFYRRMQEILNIRFPDCGKEIGVDLLWLLNLDSIPGGAISDILNDGDAMNGDTLSELGVDPEA